MFVYTFFMGYNYFLTIPIILILWIFFGVIGFCITPTCIQKKLDSISFTFLSSCIGLSAWCCFTMCGTALFPYTKPYILSILAIAIIITFIRRAKIKFHISNLTIGVALFILIAAFINTLPIVPWDFDGGYYFGNPAYDHMKAALVDSISHYGIPPVSPYLADNGVPVPVFYYYGWHGVVAQLTIITGISGYYSDLIFVGLAVMVGMSLLVGILWHLTKSKVAIWMSLLFCIFSFAFDIFATFLPHNIQDFFIYKEGNIGFWTAYSNFIWVPQHMVSGLMVVLITLYTSFLISSKNKKESIYYAIFIGIFAIGSIYCSIYAGGITLLIWAIALFIYYLLNNSFRKIFNPKIPYLLLAVLSCILMSSSYVYYLLEMNNSTNNMLEFGIFPFYEYDGILKTIAYFFHFIFILLVMRFGLIWVFLLCFLIGIRKRKLTLFQILMIIMLISCTVTIFFIHSTVYSNDFGWRVMSAPQYIIIIFASIFISRLERVRRNILLIICLILFIILTPFIYKENWKRAKTDPKIHKVFKDALPAWDKVRKYTNKKELVLTNPFSFGNLTQMEYPTNIYWGLYSQRGTPLSDYIYAKCYSEFYDDSILNDRIQKVEEFFIGAPDDSLIEYISKDLHVKAIVITPLDGIWEKPGNLDKYYILKESYPDYKIYIKNE